VSKERSSWVYCHENFQRGRPELLETLRRKTCRPDRDGDGRRICSPGAESPYKRGRDLDATTGELGGGRSDSFDDTSTESEKNGRKRSSTVTDDIIHNWENVIGFFHAKSDYLRPLAAATNHDSVSMPVLDPNQLEGISLQLKDSETGETAVAIILFCLQRNPWKDSRALFYDIFHFLTHNSKLTDEINGYSEALSPAPCHRTSSIASLRDPVSHAYQLALLDEHKQVKLRQRYARSLSLGDEAALDASSPGKRVSPGKSPVSVPPMLPLQLGQPPSELGAGAGAWPVRAAEPGPGAEGGGVGPSTIPCDGILRENETTIMRAFMSFAVTNLQTAAAVLCDGSYGAPVNACSATWQNYAQTHS
jgi:hypothetical protein